LFASKTLNGSYRSVDRRNRRESGGTTFQHPEHFCMVDLSPLMIGRCTAWNSALFFPAPAEGMTPMALCISVGAQAV
jgi:hypothetical protein